MANDITSLLYRIKENIRAIEAGDTRDPLLFEVRSDFLELVETIKLFLISERDSYYGYFMMNMQFRANFESDSIAGIKLNEFPAVFEANPLLLCKFTLKEIIYIFCHEIDHIVYNHPAEMVKANPDKDPDIFYQFNLAADAAVNDMIDHEIATRARSFMKSPDGVITSRVLADMYGLGNIPKRENYAYYFDLIVDRKSQEPDYSPKTKGEQEEGDAGKKSDDMPNGASSMMQKQNKKDSTDDGEEMQTSEDDVSEQSADGLGEEDNNNDSCSNGNGKGKGGQDHNEDQEEGKDEGKDRDEGEGESEDNGDSGNGGDRIVTAKNCGGKLTDHNWEAGNDVEDAAAAVREMVNSAMDMMNEESRGLMPAKFMSQVKEINKPAALHWQAILKKYVGTIAANKRKTRMRLNRRQPERFDLPGRVDDKVLKIVVAIDTSGSVDDKMIARIFNEIFEILAKRKHDITVIECDAAVQRVYKAKTRADIQKKVMGRGGTWFSPVIDYVNNDKYFRDALLIYFTDGFGELEIPKPRTYRNIWVVFGGAKNLSLNEPYGIVLSL